jgi:pyruvate dehydrogenase E2 component (dihydrolipoamide acetyltransferase)
MATPVRLPPIATDTTDGTLVRWLVAEGESVEEGQVVAEVDTAKVLFEVEAPAPGVVIRLLVPEGEEVRVGETLAWVGEPGEVAPTGDGPAPASSSAAAPSRPRSGDELRAAPVVRRMAERLGVDLAGVAGTGPGGRIMKEDVERAAATPGQAVRSAAERLRVAVAAAMTRSWREVPHFSCELEVDTTAREAEIEAHGLTAVLLAAVARRLAADPLLNATYDEVRGRVPGEAVNLGVAVAVEGGLVVPVIHEADRLTTAELREAVTALGLKARGHRLTPADVDGVTFTVSNAGMSGIDAIVPIVHRPAVAILGVGARALRPTVVDGHVVPRQSVRLVLSCDHRAVDGLEASRWLVALGADLEEG